MAKVTLKKGINVGKVINKLIYMILSLWVGAEILTQVSNIVNGSESALYGGMSIVGWTVGVYPAFNASHQASNCAGTLVGTAGGTAGTNCVTATNGDGILAVIGIIAVAGIILEFVNFQM